MDYRLHDFLGGGDFDKTNNNTARRLARLLPDYDLSAHKKILGSPLAGGEQTNMGRYSRVFNTWDF